MGALEKIGFGTIVATAATIAAGLTYAVKECSDTSAEHAAKTIEMQRKIDDYERREEEAKRQAADEQAARIAELERKAAKYDELQSRKQAALEARIQELEEEITKAKKTTAK